MNRLVNEQHAWELDERREQVREPIDAVMAEAEEMPADAIDDAAPQDSTLDSIQNYLQEIGRVSLRTTQPLFFDEYRRSRETGSFILIDEATNSTVGAGMILGESA